MSEYQDLIDFAKPIIKAAGMSTMNQYPTAMLYAQITSRLRLLQEIQIHLNSELTQLNELQATASQLDKISLQVYSRLKQDYGHFPDFTTSKPHNLSDALNRALTNTGTYDCFSKFRQSSVLQSLDALLTDLHAEVHFCQQCFAQLDIYNTIDHRPLSSFEFLHNWGDDDVYKVWKSYLNDSPAKVVRDHYFFFKAKGRKDEISEALIKGTISSRRSFTIQRILNAITAHHAAGWYMVFDTLTLRDESIQAFYETPTAIRDHVRTISRQVLEAEGRSKKDSPDDCFQYFCCPEYGSQNGRLHFHVVYFMRTLPLGSIDPNYGRRVRNYRQLTSLSKWQYGFSQPIAVRYSGDAFTRLGWLWPVDKQGKPLAAKPPIAVGYYVAKYVNKKADTDLSLKNLKGTEKWNKSLKDHFKNLPTTLFRVRMSRKFGMTMPTMTGLTFNSLVEMTKLSKECTPYPAILKQNSKKEIKSRLAGLTLSNLLDAKPNQINMLAYLRSMTRNAQHPNLQNFIDSLTLKLAPTDISDETKDYLTNGNLHPIPFKQRPRTCFGSK